MKSLPEPISTYPIPPRPGADPAAGGRSVSSSVVATTRR